MSSTPPETFSGNLSFLLWSVCVVSVLGAHADATLETHADLSTLAAHYKTQLEQAGCVLTEEDQHGPFAWNTWTLKEDDEQWYGFFMILLAARRYRCYAGKHLQIIQQKKAQLIELRQ